MRLIIILLLLPPYFIVSLPVMLCVLIVRKFNPHAGDMIVLRFVQFALKAVTIISGSKVTVNGLENIPKDEAVLFVGNHTSIFDIIVTYPLMKRPTGFVSKKEFRKIPIFSWLMLLLHCLFLDRSDPRSGLKMVLSAAELIQGGTSIVIFPEGTRSVDGKLMKFKDGAFKIAEKSKCPIVPMGITGTPEIFERHMPWPKPSKVTVNFGTPIETKDLSRQEIKQISGIVHQEVAKLSGQA